MLIECTHEMYSVFFEHFIKRGNRKAKQLNYVIVTANIINKTKISKTKIISTFVQSAM